jgi:ABC-type sugar transport system ATPase subunit
MARIDFDDVTVAAEGNIVLHNITWGSTTVSSSGYGVTTVMMTNDPDDAMSMPSRLMVIDSGRVAQIDTPAGVRKRPATIDAAPSTGECWLLPATVLRADEFVVFDGVSGRSICWVG